jgi:hypothetical protein
MPDYNLPHADQLMGQPEQLKENEIDATWTIAR